MSIPVEIVDLCNEVYQQENITIEDKLRKMILHRRYRNLCDFLSRQKGLYARTGIIENSEIEELKKLLFLHNDLKELVFIGPDLYSNATFFRHRIPYLYRSVGKDDLESGAISSAKDIFDESLEQIKSGNNGNVYSYSKCLGRVLFKYTTIKKGEEKVTLELRNNVSINAVSYKGEEMSIHRFAQLTSSKTESINGDVYYSVDMSNVRDNSVGNLKQWFMDYLPDVKFIQRFGDIYDPIGDAEVITNFTNADADQYGKPIFCESVRRIELNKEDLCIILGLYTLGYFNKQNKLDEGKARIKRTIDIWDESLREKCPEYADKFYIFDIYRGILNNDISLLETKYGIGIDWDNEKFYMSRIKKEKQIGGDNELVQGLDDIFKGYNSEPLSSIWKQLLSSSI